MGCIYLIAYVLGQGHVLSTSIKKLKLKWANHLQALRKSILQDGTRTQPNQVIAHSPNNIYGRHELVRKHGRLLPICLSKNSPDLYHLPSTVSFRSTYFTIATLREFIVYNTECTYKNRRKRHFNVQVLQLHIRVTN